LAKLTGSTKAQKLNDNNSADDTRSEVDAGEGSLTPASAADEVAAGQDEQNQPAAGEATAVAATGTMNAGNGVSVKKNFDTLAFADLGSNFGRDLKASVDAFETASRKWMLLADQLVEARNEIERLGGVEVEHDRLAKLYAGEKAMTEKLESDLRETKAKEIEASERATKFEEICETIKERAFEIHTALQEVRANEQKLQGELTGAQSELTELRRAAQEEAAARVSAEDQIAKLRADVAKFEADDASARERMAKLIEDNKAMAGQVPQLLADRDNWQKQFSASERENTRMQQQRTIANDRIADLENEIRTLRSDLASLTSAHAAAMTKVSELEPDANPVDDDLDLAASLDRAFSSDDGDSEFEPVRKTAG
jgi:chromosome segregation ATPase